MEAEVLCTNSDGDVKLVVNGSKWIFNPEACTLLSSRSEENDNDDDDDTSDDDDTDEVSSMFQLFLVLHPAVTASFTAFILLSCFFGRISYDVLP